MKLLALSTVFVAMVGLFGDLYRRFDVDYMEGDCLPRRWVSWGSCIPMSGIPEHTFRYLHIFLPFSKLAPDYNSDRGDVWHQLVVRMFAGKWKYHWVRIYD